MPTNPYYIGGDDDTDFGGLTPAPGVKRSPRELTSQETASNPYYISEDAPLTSGNTAEPMSFLDRVKEYGRKSKNVGKAAYATAMDVVGLPKLGVDTAVRAGADALGVGDQFHEGNEAGQLLRRAPLIAGYEAAGNAFYDAVAPYAPKVADALRGAQEGFLEKGSALATDPALLALPESKLVGLAFAPSIVEGAGHGIGEGIADIEQGNVRQGAEKLTGGLVDTAFATQIGSHLVRAPGLSDRAALGETNPLTRQLFAERGATGAIQPPKPFGPLEGPDLYAGPEEPTLLQTVRQEGLAPVALPLTPETYAALPQNRRATAEKLAETEALMSQGPTTITPNMRGDLLSMGYPEADIAAMTPAQAWDALGRPAPLPSARTPQPTEANPYYDETLDTSAPRTLQPLVDPTGAPIEATPPPAPFRGRVQTEAEVRAQILQEAEDAARTQPRLVQDPGYTLSPAARAVEGVEAPSTEYRGSVLQGVRQEAADQGLRGVERLPPPAPIGEEVPFQTPPALPPAPPQPGRRVFHLSQEEGITNLSPEEATRRTQSYSEEGRRSDRVPRVNLYAEGAQPEARFRTRSGEVAPNLRRYESELPAGTKIYDLEADPGGLVQQGLRGTELERAVVDAGYQGIERGGSIAYFGEPLAARMADRVGGSGELTPAPRGADAGNPPPAPSMEGRLLEAISADTQGAATPPPRLRTAEGTRVAASAPAEPGIPRAQYYRVRSQQAFGIRDEAGNLVPREQRRVVPTELPTDEFKEGMLDAAKQHWGEEGAPGIQRGKTSYTQEDWTVHRDQEGKITAAAVVKDGVLAYWAGDGPGTGLVIRRVMKDHPDFRIPADQLSADSSRALNTVLERGGKRAEMLREMLWPTADERGILDFEAQLKGESTNARQETVPTAGEAGGLPPAPLDAGGPPPAVPGGGRDLPGAGPEAVRPSAEVAHLVAAGALAKRIRDIGDRAYARVEENNRRIGGGLTGADTAVDLAVYGASRIMAGAVDFAAWSGHMVERFGEKIQPQLKDLWEKAKEMAGFLREQYASSPQSKSVERVGYAVRGVAARYAKEHGIDYDPRTRTIAALDEARAKRIADAFDEMQHNPNDPRVKASYDAMIRDVEQQWQFLKKEGYKLEPWKGEGQPYANSKEMREDVVRNKHLFFFQGGDMPADHPLAKMSGEAGLTFNDKFRAVHDVFAHAKEGFEFGPKGEDNAWREHWAMFDPLARPAMTTETRGQNSWVNFGKHLRTPWGEVPKKGEEGYVAPVDRPYAEQKAGLLPEEFTISQVRPRSRTEAEAVREDLSGKIKGTGRNGAVGVEDVARALEARTREGNRPLEAWGDLTPEETANAMARAERQAKAEIEYQLEQKKTGVGWYTEDISKLEESVKQVFPELENPKQMSLFKAVVAATSPGNRPNLNLDTAAQIWERYKKDGVFPDRQESGKEWPGAPTFGNRSNPEGQSAAKKLQALVDRFGEEGAADWLQEEHTVKELREFNKNVPGKMDAMLPGFHILGEKAGPFGLNLHGRREGLTADMWFSRTWNRWMGTMFNKEGLVDAPRNEAERNVMRASMDKLAKEFDLDVADAQAVLWYYEQQLYRQLGAEKIIEGSYADAGKRLVEKRNAPQQGQLDLGGVRRGAEEAGGKADERGQVPQPREGAAGSEEGGKFSGEAATQELSWLDAAADRAEVRLKERAEKMGKDTAAGGLDPSFLSDAAMVGARWIRDGITSIGEFTAKLVKTFGEYFSDMAGSVFKEASNLLRTRREEAPLAPPEAKKTTGTARPIPPEAAPGRSRVGPAAGPVPDAGVPSSGAETAKAAAKALRQRNVPTDQGPNVDVRVDRLRKAEAQGGRNPTTLSRDTKRPWEDIQPEVQKIDDEWSDEKFHDTLKKRQLNDVETQAWAGRIRQKEEALTEALGKFQAAKSQNRSDTKTLEQDYKVKLEDYVRAQGAHIESGTIQGRAFQSRKALVDASNYGPHAFARKLLTELPGIGEEKVAALLDIYHNDPANLPNAIRAVQQKSAWDKLLFAFRGHILSAFSTDFANHIGNAMKQHQTSADTAVAAVVDKAISAMRGTPRERFVGETRAEYAAMIGAAPEAMRQYAKDMMALAAGKEVLDLDKPLSHVNPIAGKYGKFLGFQFGKLNAGDNAAKITIQSAEIAKRAYRKAASELGSNAKATTIQNRAAEIARETLDPNGKITHADIWRGVEQAKKERTFQDDPWNLVKKIELLVHDHPYMGFIFTFNKTPANIARDIIRHSPAGFVPAFKAVKDMKAGKISQGEAADIISKPIVGTAILGSAIAAAYGGAMTGGGPADPKDKALLRETGWQPYSFKIPLDFMGKSFEGAHLYVPFNRFEPVSSLLGFAADFKEIREAKDAGDAFDKGLGSLVQNLTSKTYLQGLADAGEAIGRPKEFLGRYLQGFAGNVVPNIVVKGTQAIDPTLRDTTGTSDHGSMVKYLDGVRKHIISRIPGASMSLPPKYSATGEVSERGGNALTRFASPSIPSTEKIDKDLEKVMSEVGVSDRPQKVLRVSGGGSVPLSDSEYALVAKAYREAAVRAKQVIKTDYFKKLPDTEDDGPGVSKADVLKKLMKGAKDRARMYLYQNAEFRKKAAKIQKDFRNKPAAE